MINETQALYRILDANLDRSREGLRVIEEWCRFGLDDSKSALHCKNMRQELAKWHSNELRSARNTPEDVGTSLSHPQEEIRSDLKAVLQANFCRIQEALRVLEEYGKLSDGKFAGAMKQLRYQMYSLESQLMGKSRQQRLQEAKLYLVTSPVTHCLEVVESGLQGGLTLVQYRHKTENDPLRYEEARQLKELCHRYGALFLVNDRVDIALAVGADGVHLGQTDLPVPVARQLLGADKIIGKSTTNPTEMTGALQENVDYIGVGPVYATPTKAGKAPSGLEYVRYAQENSTVPWFAIGGIDDTNITAVTGAGASRVAVVRAVMGAESPLAMTQTLLSLLK